MEFDPALILIILFIVAPLLERLFKAGRQQQKPPEERPQRRVPPPRPRPEQRPRPQPRSEDEAAADMLPDDLWEILTGERRQRPRVEPPAEPPPVRAEQRQPVPIGRPEPQRPPAPRPRAADQSPARERPALSRAPDRLPEVSMRTELPPEEEAQAWRPRPVEAPVEGYVREIPTYAPPEIVSLEELVIDDEKRHQRFHQRVVDMSAAAVVQRRAAHPLLGLLRTPAGVRRAIVLREVLGPPKGLE